MSAPVDVLAVLDDAAFFAAYGTVLKQRLLDSRAAVAELIEADIEYDNVRREWDIVTTVDPGELSDKEWRRMAERFEGAVMRRAAALARVGAK